MENSNNIGETAPSDTLEQTPNNAIAPADSNAIPSLTGRDLLAAVHQAETGEVEPFSEENLIEANGHAIPLTPKLLSMTEIEALMRTEAYRSWYHPASVTVRDTVSKWFGLTYPGTLNGQGDSDDSVICTELYRNHIISNEQYLADAAFGREINPLIIHGYHL